MLCFRKTLVAKKFVDKKDGGVTNFSVKKFCLKVPKNFVGEPSNLSLISGIEKVWMRGWGECQLIPFKTSCLTVPKIFVGEPFVLCFRKLLVAKKFMDKKGGGSVKIFRRKFFVRKCRKIS